MRLFGFGSEKTPEQRIQEIEGRSSALRGKFAVTTSDPKLYSFVHEIKKLNEKLEKLKAATGFSLPLHEIDDLTIEEIDAQLSDLKKEASTVTQAFHKYLPQQIATALAGKATISEDQKKEIKKHLEVLRIAKTVADLSREIYERASQEVQSGSKIGYKSFSNWAYLKGGTKALEVAILQMPLTVDQLSRFNRDIRDRLDKLEEISKKLEKIKNHNINPEENYDILITEYQEKSKELSAILQKRKVHVEQIYKQETLTPDDPVKFPGFVKIKNRISAYNASSFKEYSSEDFQNLKAEARLYQIHKQLGEATASRQLDEGVAANIKQKGLDLVKSFQTKLASALKDVRGIRTKNPDLVRFQNELIGEISRLQVDAKEVVSILSERSSQKFNQLVNEANKLDKDQTLADKREELVDVLFEKARSNLEASIDPIESNSWQKYRTRHQSSLQILGRKLVSQKLSVSEAIDTRKFDQVTALSPRQIAWQQFMQREWDAAEIDDIGQKESGSSVTIKSLATRLNKTIQEIQAAFIAEQVIEKANSQVLLDRWLTARSKGLSPEVFERLKKLPRQQFFAALCVERNRRNETPEALQQRFEKEQLKQIQLELKAFGIQDKDVNPNEVLDLVKSAEISKTATQMELFKSFLRERLEFLGRQGPKEAGAVEKALLRLGMTEEESKEFLEQYSALKTSPLQIDENRRKILEARVLNNLISNLAPHSLEESFEEYMVSYREVSDLFLRKIGGEVVPETNIKAAIEKCKTALTKLRKVDKTKSHNPEFQVEANELEKILKWSEEIFKLQKDLEGIEKPTEKITQAELQQKIQTYRSKLEKLRAKIKRENPEQKVLTASSTNEEDRLSLGYSILAIPKDLTHGDLYRLLLEKKTELDERLGNAEESFKPEVLLPRFEAAIKAKVQDKNREIANSTAVIAQEKVSLQAIEEVKAIVGRMPGAAHEITRDHLETLLQLSSTQFLLSEFSKEFPNKNLKPLENLGIKDLLKYQEINEFFKKRILEKFGIEIPEDSSFLPELVFVREKLVGRLTKIERQQEELENGAYSEYAAERLLLDEWHLSIEEKNDFISNYFAQKSVEASFKNESGDVFVNFASSLGEITPKNMQILNPSFLEEHSIGREINKQLERVDQIKNGETLSKKELIAFATEVRNLAIRNIAQYPELIAGIRKLCLNTYLISLRSGQIADQVFQNIKKLVDDMDLSRKEIQGIIKETFQLNQVEKQKYETLLKRLEKGEAVSKEEIQTTISSYRQRYENCLREMQFLSEKISIPTPIPAEKKNMSIGERNDLIEAKLIQQIKEDTRKLKMEFLTEESLERKIQQAENRGAIAKLKHKIAKIEEVLLSSTITVPENIEKLNEIIPLQEEYSRLLISYKDNYLAPNSPFSESAYDEISLSNPSEIGRKIEKEDPVDLSLQKTVNEQEVNRVLERKSTAQAVLQKGYNLGAENERVAYSAQALSSRASVQLQEKAFRLIVRNNEDLSLLLSKFSQTEQSNIVLKAKEESQNLLLKQIQKKEATKISSKINRMFSDGGNYTQEEYKQWMTWVKPALSEEKRLELENKTLQEQLDVVVQFTLETNLHPSSNQQTMEEVYKERKREILSQFVDHLLSQNETIQSSFKNINSWISGEQWQAWIQGEIQIIKKSQKDLTKIFSEEYFQSLAQKEPRQAIEELTRLSGGALPERFKKEMKEQIIAHLQKKRCDIPDIKTVVTLIENGLSLNPTDLSSKIVDFVSQFPIKHQDKIRSKITSILSGEIKTVWIRRRCTQISGNTAQMMESLKGLSLGKALEKLNGMRAENYAKDHYGGTLARLQKYKEKARLAFKTELEKVGYDEEDSEILIRGIEVPLKNSKPAVVASVTKALREKVESFVRADGVDEEKLRGLGLLDAEIGFLKKHHLSPQEARQYFYKTTDLGESQPLVNHRSRYEEVLIDRQARLDADYERLISP